MKNNLVCRGEDAVCSTYPFTFAPRLMGRLHFLVFIAVRVTYDCVDQWHVVRIGFLLLLVLAHENLLQSCS